MFNMNSWTAHPIHNLFTIDSSSYKILIDNVWSWHTLNFQNSKHTHLQTWFKKKKKKYKSVFLHEQNSIELVTVALA